MSLNDVLISYDLGNYAFLNQEVTYNILINLIYF